MDKREMFEDLINKKEYRKAEILLEIEKTEGGNYWLYCNIGWILGRIGNRDEALKYLKKAEGMGEIDENGWLSCEFAWNYSELGDYKLAEYYLKTAKKFGRDDSWVNFVFGWNLGKLKI